MDIIDQAADREQMDRDLAIAASHRHAPALTPVGVCYNCESSVPDGACFCDRDCRDDYERRQRAERLKWNPVPH